MKALKTLILTILILFAAILSAGTGHGNFLIVKIIYPYAMLITLFREQVGIAGIVLALIEIPLYALILEKKPQWKWYLFALHVLAAAAVLFFNGNF